MVTTTSEYAIRAVGKDFKINILNSSMKSISGNLSVHQRFPHLGRSKTKLMSYYTTLFNRILVEILANSRCFS